MSHEQEIERAKKYYTQRLSENKASLSNWLMPAPLYIIQRREEAMMHLVNKVGIKDFSQKTFLAQIGSQKI